jgi:hypothetical protein
MGEIVRPTPQGGDYRPHYRKREADAYIAALEAELQSLREKESAAFVDGFEACRCRCLCIVDEHDGYLNRIELLEAFPAPTKLEQEKP